MQTGVQGECWYSNTLRSLNATTAFSIPGRTKRQIRFLLIARFAAAGIVADIIQAARSEQYQVINGELLDRNGFTTIQATKPITSVNLLADMIRNGSS